MMPMTPHSPSVKSALIVASIPELGLPAYIFRKRILSRATKPVAARSTPPGREPPTKPTVATLTAQTDPTSGKQESFSNTMG